MKINPGNARGLLVPQGDRPFSFVVYSSEIRDFGVLNRFVYRFANGFESGEVNDSINSVESLFQQFGVTNVALYESRSYLCNCFDTINDRRIRIGKVVVDYNIKTSS